VQPLEHGAQLGRRRDGGPAKPQLLQMLAELAHQVAADTGTRRRQVSDLDDLLARHDGATARGDRVLDRLSEVALEEQGVRAAAVTNRGDDLTVPLEAHQHRRPAGDARVEMARVDAGDEALHRGARRIVGTVAAQLEGHGGRRRRSGSRRHGERNLHWAHRLEGMRQSRNPTLRHA
jgi:hypothetical protein